MTWISGFDASIAALDQDVREDRAEEAVEHDRLGEGEAEPLDALQLAAQLGLAGDRLDHRAEDVADADAGAERAEADAQRERDRLAGVGAVVGLREQGLPSKAMSRWFPYVATLLLFIFVVNLIGFIPLPLTGETYHGIPTWGIYAATSSLSVTLALALLTFVFTHYEGVKWNGPVRYFKSWIPEAPKGLLVLIVPLEILGQFMRLISLSVRLFANMLAGHILILTFLGLIFIFQSVVLGIMVIPATIFYLFEVIIVVGIQAFIFAALSAIYIGSAIEPEH